MDKEYESLYHLSEEKNWWFAARRNTIKRILKHTHKQARILDIGCGGGALAVELGKAGFTNVVSIDFSAEAIEICKQRGLTEAYVMDAHQLGFPDESFDLLIASDNLEHLQDDKKALRDWKRVLKQNGKMHIFVPAYQFLWSSHDVINHHFRRYTRENLVKKLSAEGLKIHRTSYWNFSLFFPTAVFRFKEKLFPKKQEDHGGQIVNPPSLINRSLILLLRIEDLFFSVTGFPIGVSVYVSATKDQN